MYWQKCLSVSQLSVANEATCGYDNEIAVKHSAFRLCSSKMIPHEPLILLQKHNERHVERTMNTYALSKVRKGAQGNGFIVNRFGHQGGPKASDFNAIIMIFSPRDHSHLMAEGHLLVLSLFFIRLLVFDLNISARGE